MTEDAHCPDDERLVARAAQALGAPEAAAIDTHVATCDVCRTVLADAARGHDTLPSHHAQRARLTRGTAIGRYLVLDAVGSGGMGVVYAVYDPELDRRVALKMLHSAGARANERLLHEARAMARLAHPNLVPIYDSGTWAGRVYLTMEFVVGQTLRAWLTTPRSAREVLAAYAAAGAGLLAAHRAGVVHRDFKPENVMVGADGRVRVLDFGLAHATPSSDADDLGAGLAQPTGAWLTGALLGTPRYMAPEQRAGQAADARADQYSFCLALNESLGGGLPRRLTPVVARALSERPADRFETLEPVLDALAAAPSSGRRRAAALTGALALAVGGTWLLATPQRACEATADEVAQVWGPAQRATVRAAFESVGAPFAATAFARTAAALDAHAAAIASARRQLCEADRVALLTPVVHATRADCLTARQRELAALADIFASADAEVVGQAGRPPLPRGAREPAATDLARARASLLTARLAEAETAARAALAAAEGLTPGERAEAALLLGRSLLHRSANQPARVALREALFAGERAQRADVRFRAWVDLAELEGLQLLDFEAGAVALAHAEATLEGLPEPGVFRDELLLAKSLHAAAGGDGPGAVALAEAGLALRAERRGAGHPTLLPFLVQLAEAHRVALDTARAEQSARAALELGLQAFGPGDARVMRALITLSLIHQTMGRFDQARREAQEVEALTTARFGARAPRMLPVLLRRTNLEREAGEVGAAKAVFRRYRALAETLPDREWAANFEVMEGLNALADGDAATAYPLLETAVRTTEAMVGLSEVGLVQLLAPLATAAFRAGVTHRGREALDRCFALLAQARPPLSGRVDEAWLTAQASLESGHRLAEGRALAEQARGIWRGANDHFHLGRLEAWLAQHPQATDEARVSR